MKNRLRLALILIVLSSLTMMKFTSTEAAPPNTIEGNIDDVARAILTYFPKVDGEIVALRENQVEVELGKQLGLASGILLTVYREDKPFFHPVTGVPLGRFEDELGIVEVIRLERPHLLAEFIGPTKRIQKGDRVRLPATRIPMAVSMTSDKGHAFLMNELVAALNETGRFNIVTLPPGSQLEAARSGGNRYFIPLEIGREEGRFSMLLTIKNTYSAKSIAEIHVIINQSEESDLILEHLQYQLFEQRQNN
ncbi:MAG: hypothetical protein ACE5GK_08645 [Nitrospiria bacterium]